MKGEMSQREKPLVLQGWLNARPVFPISPFTFHVSPHPTENRLKRRAFLAASALFPLIASNTAYAQKKPVKKATTAKPAAKSNVKPGSKTPAKPTSTRKPAPKPVASSEASAPPVAEPRNVISLPEEPPARWRTFDIKSEIELKRVRGKARLWLPLAQYKDTLWERSLGHTWEGNFASAGIYRDPVGEMEVFYADWPEGIETPRLQIVSQIATQDRHFDITRRGAIAERTEVLRRCLQPSLHVPIDGAVRQNAERAIGRVKDPLAMSKAIYDWVVDNSEFDSNGKGVGRGDVAALLDAGRPFFGRSADISLLFVALCRSVGIPARPVFGLRMGTSRLFGSLGILGELNEAQHCRAEFYIPGYGWIGVDPADVRKAIREENLDNHDPKLTVLKKLLFGFWEMNWVSLNAAQDVRLRGLDGDPLPWLLYPVVETGEWRLDHPDSSRINYSVTASRSEEA